VRANIVAISRLIVGLEAWGEDCARAVLPKETRIAARGGVRQIPHIHTLSVEFHRSDFAFHPEGVANRNEPKKRNREFESSNLVAGFGAFRRQGNAGRSYCLCDHVVSECLLTVPGATHRQQVHSAVVWRLCSGLDDQHARLPGSFARGLPLLAFGFLATLAGKPGSPAPRTAGRRFSSRHGPLLKLAVSNHT